MNLAGIARRGALLALALFVLDWFGVTPAGLWRSGAAKLEAFKNDTRQVASGEAVDKVSQKMRAEMKESQQVQIFADPEMSRELQAERARVMEAKLKALQEKQIVPVEQGQLARQVAENARRSGGDH